MILQQVDYDAVAPTYDRRFAEERRSGTLVALKEMVQAVWGDISSLRAPNVLEF